MTQSIRIATAVRVCLFAAFAASAGCTLLPGDRAHQQAHELDARELHAAFSNHTVTSKNLKTGTVSVSYYAPDGSVRQVRDGRRREGAWRIRPEGEICLQMQSRKESCRIVRRDPDDLLRKYRTGSDGLEALIVYQAFVRGDHLKESTDAPERQRASREGRKADRRAEVQRLLALAGYSPGPVDGIWGPRSRSALMRFERDHGLPVTGKPGKRVHERLSAIAR